MKLHERIAAMDRRRQIRLMDRALRRVVNQAQVQAFAYANEHTASRREVETARLTRWRLVLMRMYVSVTREPAGAIA